MSLPTAQQLLLRLRPSGGSSFANFCPGPNLEVFRRVEQAVRHGTEPTLYLWGPEGSGKTHLLEAACGLHQDTNAPMAYVPLGNHAELSPDVLGGLEQVQLTCLDDLDAVAGQTPWELALFHLYNRCRDQGARLLFAARRSPRGLGLGLADLASRLSASLVLRLRPLDDAGRLEALRLRARERGMELPHEAGRYLLSRQSRDLHSLFGLLERLDEASLRAQRRLTVPFIKEVLGQG